MRVSFKKVMTHENLSVILTRHMQQWKKFLPFNDGKNEKL